jgi:hypothetical protein
LPLDAAAKARKYTGMSRTFFILMTIAMLATLAALIMGVFGMARGGKFNKKYGNKLMRARIFLQAAALGLFVLAILAARS